MNGHLFQSLSGKALLFTPQSVYEMPLWQYQEFERYAAFLTKARIEEVLERILDS